MTPTQERALAAYREHGSYGKAAAALGLDKAGVQRTVKRALAAQSAEADMDPGIRAAMSEVGLSDPLALSHAWIKTQDPDTGRGVSAFVKVKPPETEPEDIAEALSEALETHRGACPEIRQPDHVDEDLATFYPRTDLHIGQMSWEPETGQNWDLRRATEEIGDAASQLVGCSPPSHTAIIAGMGDHYHADDQSNRTPTSGHALDVDGRYYKVLTAGAWLDIAMIKLALQKHQHVEYNVMRGNHDPHAADALRLAVSMFFDNHPRVTIHQCPADRWYFKWGRNLIGTAHGHRLKIKDAAPVMLSEQRHKMADVDWMVFYLGHFHHREELYQHGVMARRLGAPPAQDAYAAGGPWAPDRLMESFTYHKTRGEIARQSHFMEAA